MLRQNAFLSAVGQRGCPPVAGGVTSVLCLIISVVFGQGVARSDEQVAIAAEQKITSRLELLKQFEAEFVAITPGRGTFPKTLSMGSEGGPTNERPVRVVTLDEEFWMARYEVPQNLFEAVTGRNPALEGSAKPVEMVSWQEASDFCQLATRLMRAEKLIDDVEIRLPTEAEWNIAAAGSTTTQFWRGDWPG
jgi:formylglycine-generating enzyme required for sulfatase activity